MTGKCFRSILADGTGITTTIVRGAIWQPMESAHNSATMVHLWTSIQFCPPYVTIIKPCLFTYTCICFDLPPFFFGGGGGGYLMIGEPPPEETLWQAELWDRSEHNHNIRLQATLAMALPGQRWGVCGLQTISQRWQWSPVWPSLCWTLGCPAHTAVCWTLCQPLHVESSHKSVVSFSTKENCIHVLW